MSQHKEQKEWEGRIVPLGLFSDPKMGVPMRVLLVYASWGNPSDGGWCPLSTRSVASLCGLIPKGFVDSTPTEIELALTRFRQARTSLIKQGLMGQRQIVNAHGTKEIQYRHTCYEVPDGTLLELNKLSRRQGVTYSRKEMEIGFESMNPTPVAPAPVDDLDLGFEFDFNSR